ncbi:SusC/RagA family TonB-linked outer membrane protein [Hallella multisaccharivorax DSM 17128]|uniref:TonB-dependent receptor plug n=1 Tax=Hallella multisaccharivorax DSM 17128 TaxID=688246 RepID=F8NCT1_9BACT|nr:TonB-dependent receptor [Hallella multisaccharivorax]EGN58116.1 TonB-dependent receptor plug [Hallella multisaccharivorax DSM 17128]GJG31788.1 SusC/RagA family TonB-linked outer membrane protein [Hallella multisaccharivorax DSM 17128]
MMKSHYQLGLLAILATIAGGGSVSAASSVDATAITQQDGQCTGVVKDGNGEPVIGASVFVKGTRNGAVTDLDGRFSLTGVKRGSALHISYVGYNDRDVVWDGSALNVILTDNERSLNEVVVVGFGTQKKANLTGAVATIDAKNLVSRPVNSAIDAMQGMIPGMNFSIGSGGGALNSNTRYNIRGTGTIGAGSSVAPLVLIDGMEGDLNAINPQDIDNISVLKDAASSSIYGSRAAGGVILVTTKSGKAGKTTVNYNNNFRFNSPENMPHQLDSYNWALYMNAASINAGSGTWFSDNKLADIKKAQSDPTMRTMFANAQGRWEIWDANDLLPIANHDWLRTCFGNGFSQEHNVSVNGGTDRVHYYFSGNFLNRRGLLKYGTDKRNRYTITSKVDAQITNWAKLTYNMRFARTDYNQPTMLDDLYYHNMCRYWPIIPVYDPNGHFVVTGSNPGDLVNGGDTREQTDVNSHQLSLQLTPLNGLVINAEFNYSITNYNQHVDWQTTYGYDVNNVPYVFNNPNNAVKEYARKTNYFNPNIYADYSFTLANDHHFKVMAGYQSEELHQRWIQGQQSGIIANLPTLHTTATNPSVDGKYDEWATMGVFGRLNYDYQGRYLVEGNLRYDGTSRFLKDNRWVWSPSFSLGWNIARENFWKPIEQYINLLKFRFSWGKLGNQNTDSWYPFYSTVGYSNQAGTWLVGGKKQNISSMPALVSSTLTWEKNRTINYGVDWGAFNNRLTGSFELFSRKTYDMVGPAPELPAILGTDAPKVNNLDMTSRGFDLQISWRDRIKDFNYGVILTMTDGRVKIDKYPNPSKTLSMYYKGAYLGDIWGYTTVGIAKTDEEMAEHLKKADQSAIGSNWAAGDIMYADLDGDGKVNGGEGTADKSGDRRIIGNSTPRYNFGLNLTAAWKGFDLKVFFQGTLKRDYAPGASDAVFWGACGIGKWQATGFKQHLDFFRSDPNDPLGQNLDSYYPRANWNGGRNNQTQTKYLQNAAYCRLKNLTIGYTIPQNITRRFYVQNLRVFFSAENLFTITSFTKLGDPEIIDASGWGFSKAYPLTRNFAFGLSVTL